MKRFITIFLLILSICVTLFFTVSLPFTADGPEAEAGLINFENADFNKEIYALKGEWEFYFGRLYTPEDFKKGRAEGVEYVSLPDAWKTLGYPDQGYGTYRLTISTGSDRPLLLDIPEITSASVIWANGGEVYRAGQVGTSAGETKTSIRSDLVAVVPQNRVLELVVQVANFHMYDGGLFYPIRIGSDSVLLHHILWQRIMVAAALGGILLMGVYHLFLYAFRRRERLYLTFSFICVTTVLRLAMETNNLAQYFLPGGLGVVAARMYLLFFALNGLSICFFMLQAFSICLNRWLRVIYAAGFALPIAVICWPGSSFPTAVASLFLILIPYAVSVILVLRSGKIGRDPYRLLFLFSLVTFTFYAPVTKTVFEGDLFVPAIGPNMFLILSQCIMLSRDYAEARNEAERINANLEQLVEQRTEQLCVANQQLAASQAALREMIANISHDLKTPLTVLNNYLELLGDDAVVVNEQERAEYLGIAYHKNLDLQRLIHNLFDVTRMESGTAVYRMERISASLLMRDADCKYAELVRDSGLRFYAEAEAGTEVEADPDKIWSILDNLVYNALRHTPPGGSITLKIRQNRDCTELTVTDTGEGIAPEHLPHIFERFYKVSPERGEKDGSSGLGLYIVKTAVEAMGGTVEVESLLNKGTTFRIKF